MAGIAATVDSESAKKANVICKRDHYVGGNMANIYINERIPEFQLNINKQQLFPISYFQHLS